MVIQKDTTHFEELTFQMTEGRPYEAEELKIGPFTITYGNNPSRPYAAMMWIGGNKSQDICVYRRFLLFRKFC